MAYDRINGVNYHRVDLEPSGSLISQMDALSDAVYDRFNRVQKIFGRFDIVHGHDWHLVRALSKIKSEAGLPYVITIHSTEWGRNGNSFCDTPDSREISHREWLAGYESSKIIAASKHMRDELISIFSIPEEKICTVPNGIVFGKIQKSLDPGRIKEQYGIPPYLPLVLFCGRMSHQKGPDLLVKAIPHVLRDNPDVNFIFAGEGGMAQYCREIASDLNVAESCQFLGYVPGSKKEELMNACDLVCVPSRNEPFGMIVLEAWDAIKPVVATEAVSIVKNFEDGLLAYIQPESIAWCINNLIDDPLKMQRIARAGNERLRSEFSWEQIAMMTEEVYRTVRTPPGKG